MARYLITSALPYVNGIKHLGNLAGSMLPADVFARFQRLAGHEVMFICATDEHGTPAELAAQAQGSDTQTYCDRQYQIQRAAGDAFALDFDWFGRSSCPQNHILTRQFAQRLEAAGLIREQISTQIYSHQDQRFLPDRYVQGTCPKCGYERARGDQCDQCGSLLDPIDLLNPRSAISGSTKLEPRETRHLFLLQSTMQDSLRAWVDAAQDWPSLARSIAYKWLDEGLRDRAITRDLDWGVKVSTDQAPREGFEDKVFYVWFDAPIAYIAATAQWAEAQNQTDAAWQRWWRTDMGAKDVTYVQFMGKDNVAFHTISFPATLIGSGEAWKRVDRLKAFNWMTWYGGKFSTSQQRGLFMDQALELLPADYWRWYLIANAPESSDTAFTWESFQTQINSDLANVLGNLVNRLTRYCAAKFAGRVPQGMESGALEQTLKATLTENIQMIEAHFEAMEFRKAATAIRSLWACGNEYLTEAAPWSHFKTDPERAAMAVRTGLNLACLCALIAQPIIPDSAARILDALGVDPSCRDWPDAQSPDLLDRLALNSEIQTPDILFAKIEDEQIAQWAHQFGGVPSDQDAESASA